MTESFFKNKADEKPSNQVPELEARADGNDTEQNESAQGFDMQEIRIAAILAYIPLLCFIPLLSMRENPQNRFHARQGVLLFLVELVAVIFLIDGISNFIFKGILLIALAFSIAGIYFAFKGKTYKLPIIGDLADKTKL